MNRWMGAPLVETILILLPPFLASAAALLYSPREISLLQWLVLIVFVDVAHVYSTVFRTYLDKTERKERGVLLAAVPLACYTVGVLLCLVSMALFWRVLAYVAVFHFVRQQYGLMRLYARHDRPGRIEEWLVYMAAGYPLVYWHTHDREFHWFLENDFFAIPWAVSWIAGAAYAGLVIAYLIQETGRWLRGVRNIQKNAVILGTMMSWFVGIVWLNGDFAFTVTNVLSHGLPYLALVWIHGRQRSISFWFRPVFVPLALLVLFFLAYTEEALWDALFWKERPGLFPLAASIYSFTVRESIAALLVPLLALPQATHYVLDAFIWKIGGNSSRWQSVWKPA